MATIEEIKELLRKENAPLNRKLDKLTNDIEEFRDTVKFLSAKYDNVMTQIHSVNEKLLNHTVGIKNAAKDIEDTMKYAKEAKLQSEELAQYIRRDCLEISGIRVTDECTPESIVNSVGKSIGVPVCKEDISITHPIPSYNDEAPPKIIVKFTRRQVRNDFYANRRKLASKKVKDLPDLELDNDERVFISESLTLYKKKLFGDINKLKKRWKWKYIWTNNGRIFLREADSSPVHAFDTVEDLAEFQSKHSLR